MVHEQSNEDSGILPPQLKGPYGLQQLLAMTADRMWRSQLRAIVTIAPLYGGYTIKFSENMQNTHILKSRRHQTLLFNSFSSLQRSTLECLMDSNPFPLGVTALQTATCFNIEMDCCEAKCSKRT